MGGYLSHYEEEEARRASREKLVKQLLIAAAVLLVVGVTAWFLFRNYKEEGRVKDFLSLLQKQDYKPAYAMWGCTDATPCRDYPYERFLQDWGPSSPAAASSSIHRGKVKSCDGGIIQILQVKDQEVNLYVDRRTLTLGYAPWTVCTPHVKM